MRFKENYRARPRPQRGRSIRVSPQSKPPYITPSMDFSSGKGVVRGRRGQQLEFTLRFDATSRPVYVPAR